MSKIKENSSYEGYGKYYCNSHKKLILYHLQGSFATGKYHCWDCWLDKESHQPIENVSA